MGYQTPNIDRLAKEGMMFTDSYGEQSCTAGRSSFITGQSVYRTGLSKVGIPGAPIGMNEKTRHHRRPRSRTRATRPASSARTISATSINAADQSRLRRVLRQPLPPQRRGRAGADDYSDGEGLPELQEDVRPARRHAFLGDRQGRSDRAAALGQGRQAEDRGYRPAHQEADGDLRRRVRRARPRNS